MPSTITRRRFLQGAALAALATTTGAWPQSSTRAGFDRVRGYDPRIVASNVPSSATVATGPGRRDAENRRPRRQSPSGMRNSRLRARCRLRRAVLEGGQEVDFLVIGGGFSGLSTAIEIKRRAPGARVALVEAQRIGFGASGRNAGMLVPLAAPSWLIDGALEPQQAAWALHELARRYQVLGTSPAALDGGPSPASMVFCAPSNLAGEAVTWLHRRLRNLGQTAELIGVQETHARVGEAARSSLVVPAYAVHPARLALALRQVAGQLGVSIYEHSRIERLERESSDLSAVADSGIACRAGRIICTSGAWNQELLSRP